MNYELAAFQCIEKTGSDRAAVLAAFQQELEVIEKSAGKVGALWSGLKSVISPVMREAQHALPAAVGSKPLGLLARMGERFRGGVAHAAGQDAAVLGQRFAGKATAAANAGRADVAEALANRSEQLLGRQVNPAQAMMQARAGTVQRTLARTTSRAERRVIQGATPIASGGQRYVRTTNGHIVPEPPNMMGELSYAQRTAPKPSHVPAKGGLPEGVAAPPPAPGPAVPTGGAPATATAPGSAAAEGGGVRGFANKHFGVYPQEGRGMLGGQSTGNWWHGLQNAQQRNIALAGAAGTAAVAGGGGYLLGGGRGNQQTVVYK